MQPGSQSEIVLIFSAGILIFLGMLGSVIYFIALYQRRRRIMQQQAEAAKQEFRKQLLSMQLEIREQTLQHVGQELHDNIGQLASLVKIHLNTFPPSPNPQSDLKLEETKDVTRKLISEIRALSVSLNVEHISRQGFARVLQMEIDRIQRTGAVKMHFTCPDVPLTLSGDKVVFLFRMSQEILNNAVKHSEAGNIEVTVLAKDSLMILTIVDDGKGFDVAEKMQGEGSGLANLKRRAGMIGATVHFASTAGLGTKVEIHCPMEQDG